MELTHTKTGPLLGGSTAAVQIFLAAVFCVSGATKITQSMAVLDAQFGWPGDVSEPIVRVLGVLELLGAGGIILPALTRIWPGLTSLSALALMNLMVVAGLYRLVRHEVFHLPAPVILGGMAAYVAFGRAGRVPIAGRKAR